MALTDKQEAFVNEYLKCWNATKAALIAGYSAKTAYSIGHENLKKPEISAVIDQRKAEMIMSADETLALLTEHARGTMADFIDIKHGLPFIDLAKAQAAGKLHLLKKFKNTEKGVEIELYDAQAALVHIGKHHALFTDKTDISSGGQPITGLIINIPHDDD